MKIVLVFQGLWVGYICDHMWSWVTNLPRVVHIPKFSWETPVPLVSFWHRAPLFHDLIISLRFTLGVLHIPKFQPPVQIMSCYSYWYPLFYSPKLTTNLLFALLYIPFLFGGGGADPQTSCPIYTIFVAFILFAD